MGIQFNMKFLAIFSALFLLHDALCHNNRRRSIFSWFQNDDDSKEETVVPGYKPVLEVHKYNGIQVNPLNNQALLFNSPEPIPVEHIAPTPIVTDQKFISLLHRVAHFLPEEDKLHESEFNEFLSSIVELIPDDSIDRLEFVLQSHSESRIGEKEKSKLVKLLQYLKEKKLKPIKKLYEKKKEVLQNALNLLRPSSTPPPRPEISSTEPHSPPPPPLPTPDFCSPPPRPYTLPLHYYIPQYVLPYSNAVLPEHHKFETGHKLYFNKTAEFTTETPTTPKPFVPYSESAIRPDEYHFNQLPSESYSFPTKIYFPNILSPLRPSLAVKAYPPPASMQNEYFLQNLRPPFPAPVEIDKHYQTPANTLLAPDLQMSASENQEKLGKPLTSTVPIGSEFVGENKNEFQTPIRVLSISTTTQVPTEVVTESNIESKIKETESNLRTNASTTAY